MYSSLRGDNITPESPIITLSCRFIPYDQWLTTHVDSSWKVKQLKLWLLGKCLGVSLHSQDPANIGTIKNAVATHSKPSAFPGSNGVAPSPAPRHRPASPITFAPDPRNRPISPILFAKAGKTKGKGVHHTARKASWEMHDAGGSGDMHGDDENDGDGVGGYEEDDEWDTGDEGTDEAGDDLGGGNVINPKRSAPKPTQNPLPPSVSQPLNVKSSLSTSSSINDRYNTVTSTYSLLRFSTGQKLEEEYQLSWYDLAPNELLELHAHAPVQNLPASFGLPNVNSIASKSGHAPKSTQHARTGSTSSLSRLPSRSHGHSHFDPPPTLPTRIYFPPLNRALLSSYVQPYWEGYVRALRLVWRDDSTRNLSHPAYGNSVGEAFAGGFVPAFAVFGQDAAGRDLRPLEKEIAYGGYGKAYAEMHGNGANSGKSRRTTLEWRLRWAIIRDGMLYLSKNREDEAPAQAYPLDALTALRGADHLATSSHFTRHQTSKSPTTEHPPYRQHKRGNSSQRPSPVHNGPSSANGHRHASSMDRRHTHLRDRVSDLDSDSDHDDTAAGVGMDEFEGKDLKIICIRFKAGGKVQGTFVPPTTEPRNPKKYSSTIGYGALLATGGEHRGGGGLDGHGFGKTSYVTVGDGDASPSQRFSGKETGRGKGKEKEKKKGRERFDKRGPYLRKTSLPSLGIAEGSRTFVSLLGREKEKEGGKLVKAPGKGKEKNKDWISAFGVGTKSNRDKDKSFGMGLAIPGMRKGSAGHLDKGKARDTSNSALSASASGYGYFDAGTLDGDGDGLEDPNAEGILENATFAGESEGDSDDEEDAEAGQHFGEDGDAGVRSDSPYSEPQHPLTTRVAPRSHPSQTQAVDPNSDSEASLALSSPVFRRTVDTDEEEDVDSLRSDDGKKSSVYRSGYRYGYGHRDGAEIETGKDGKGGSYGHGKGEDVEMEKLPVRDRNTSAKLKKDKTQKEKEGDERRQGDEAERHAGRQKVKENAEWIVLDMGTDLAYSSLLRILHRHFPPPMSSTFVSALPAFSTPTPVSTPTPTPTPFPSPISPRSNKSASAQSGWSSTSDDERQEISHVNRTTGEESNSSSISAHRSPSHVETPQHPPAHAVLSEHAELSLHKTFGALAYPEWRTEMVRRAQKAGMGDIGGALRWVLWQSDLQLARDIEIMQSQKNRDGVAQIPRKRRGTVGSRSSRKYRRSTAVVPDSSIDAGVVNPASSDSEVSDAGKLTAGSDSESSEAEWHGWMADLLRQQKVQAQAKRAREDAEVIAVQQRLAFQEGDHVEEPPMTPAEDRRLLLDKRRALEPVGVVTTAGLNVPSSSSVVSTPSTTLYSHSSSESLARRQRARALSFSPQAAFGPSSSHDHSLSRSISPLATSNPQRQGGHNLSHSSSMYAGLRSTSVTTEHSLRRPSMPTLTTDQILLSVSPRAPLMRVPGTPSSTYRFPPEQAVGSSSPPQFTSPFSEEITSAPWSPTPKIFPSSSAVVRGRTTSTRLGSLGRSSSIFGRSNNVLRKDADKRKERETDEKHAKEREENLQETEWVRDHDEEELDPAVVTGGNRKAQRPKLSVATPSSSQHTILHEPQSPPLPVRKPKHSIMRRVRSGSNLKSPLEEQEPASSTPGALGKRKKGIFGDKFVRRLDSALDFVDGR